MRQEVCTSVAPRQRYSSRSGQLCGVWTVGVVQHLQQLLPTEIFEPIHSWHRSNVAHLLVKMIEERQSVNHDLFQLRHVVTKQIILSTQLISDLSPLRDLSVQLSSPQYHFDGVNLDHKVSPSILEVGSSPCTNSSSENPIHNKYVLPMRQECYHGVVQDLLRGLG